MVVTLIHPVSVPTSEGTELTTDLAPEEASWEGPPDHLKCRMAGQQFVLIPVRNVSGITLAHGEQIRAAAQISRGEYR